MVMGILYHKIGKKERVNSVLWRIKGLSFGTVLGIKGEGLSLQKRSPKDVTVLGGLDYAKLEVELRKTQLTADLSITQTDLQASQLLHGSEANDLGFRALINLFH